MLKVKFSKNLHTIDGNRQLSVDFSLETSEVLLLSGTSGLGKTTILRTIAGLEDVFEGQISWKGQNWLKPDGSILIPARNRPIAMVFQDYALFPNMTVRENIAFAQDRKSQKPNEVKKWLEIFELNKLANRFPEKLSGGQQQRVAIARALARKPEILLMDEAFSAIDQENRKALIAKLEALQAEMQFACILVSHSAEELETFANRTAILTEQGIQFEDHFHPKNTSNNIQLIAEVIEFNSFNVKLSIEGNNIIVPSDQFNLDQLKIGDKLCLNWDGKTKPNL